MGRINILCEIVKCIVGTRTDLGLGSFLSRCHAGDYAQRHKYAHTLISSNL